MLKIDDRLTIPIEEFRWEFSRSSGPGGQKIIKRYYQNFDAIKFQRLSDLTTELYLAESKKSERLWKQVFETLRQLEFPASRIEHLAQKRDPAILAAILKELDGMH